MEPDKDKIIARLTARLNAAGGEKAPWKSKKLWASLVAALATIANKVFDLGLDPAELAGVAVPLIAYVIGQGMADLGKNK